jgi:hypothetical protein
MPTNQDDNSLGVLRGAKEIGAYVNLIRDDGEVDERAAYHQLENGGIPARKEGGVWTTTKSLLRSHYNTPTNLPPPNPDAEAPPPLAAARAARPTRRRVARRSARR